jgi:hypothetical protein
MTEGTTGDGLMSIFQSITNGPYSMKTWGRLCACAAGEAFLLYAILIAHTLSPVTTHLIGHSSSHPGGTARYQELFNWNGLIPTMVESLFVVAAAWSAFQLTVWALPGISLRRSQAGFDGLTQNAVVNLDGPDWRIRELSLNATAGHQIPWESTDLLH